MRALHVGVMMLAVTLPVQAEWTSMPVLEGETTIAKPVAAVGGGFTSARVRVLDKQTNRVASVVLKAKAKASSGALELILGRCAGDLQGIPGQDAAWLDVWDGANEAKLFAGWMFSAAPQVATLDHARYDVQLIGCGDVPRGRVGNKAVVTDVGGAEDDEAPQTASPAVKAGGEDFVVEGIQDKSVPGDQDQLHRLMDE